ncbi:MAG: hypothetical protein QOI61_1412 [Actinomycetota bacterium]|jgi:hypothetical protein
MIAATDRVVALKVRPIGPATDRDAILDDRAVARAAEDFDRLEAIGADRNI